MHDIIWPLKTHLRFKQQGFILAYYYEENRLKYIF